MRQNGKRGPKLRPLIDRIIEKTVIHESGCILWTGAKTSFGYGRIGRGGRGGGMVRVHRAVWEWRNRPLRGGEFVLHRCDVPSCCNPAHLFVGSKADNTRDMFAKGRSRVAKLTHGEVAHIRQSHAPLPDLAAMYGVSRDTIKDVLNGRTW